MGCQDRPQLFESICECSVKSAKHGEGILMFRSKKRCRFGCACKRCFKCCLARKRKEVRKMSESECASWHSLKLCGLCCFRRKGTAVGEELQSVVITELGGLKTVGMVHLTFLSTSRDKPCQKLATSLPRRYKPTGPKERRILTKHWCEQAQKY